MQSWVRTLESKFEKIGARILIRKSESVRGVDEFRIDVRRDRFGEFFDLNIAQGKDYDFQVLGIDPADKHLLLLAKHARERFLCGHDERHWFVAGIPGTVTSVTAAKEALKPSVVRQAQAKAGVKKKNKHKRKNKGYIRQGEWFFMPQPDLKVDPKKILRNEPMVRGNMGKPHMAEELYRIGGETVYVSITHRNGITEKEYKALLKSDPLAKKRQWQTMRRNPTAYVRGKIRHPDHKTVVLKTWHLVVPNREYFTESQAFLD